MTINVSGMGISAGTSYGAHADYLSINERRNQSPVGKVDAVNSATSKEAQNVAEEARQRYVASTSPTSTIGSKSAGQVAEQTFQLMKQNTEATSKIAAKLSAFTREPYNTSVNEKESTDDATASGVNTTVANKTNEVESGSEDNSTETEIPKRPLTRYSESDLRKMVTDGGLSASEMNAELKARESENEGTTDATNVESAQSIAMRNAIAAYNYQMSYQINAMAVQ